MSAKKNSTPAIPKFSNEHEEADWWASAEGRRFLKNQPPQSAVKSGRGSKLVTKLARSSSVQIALRLPSPDIEKAREIAAKKGIGYQTLLKMIVHEGLLREQRRH
jgi:predicted DNA binding CopG/RHH family protein